MSSFSTVLSVSVLHDRASSTIRYGVLAGSGDGGPVIKKVCMVDTHTHTGTLVSYLANPGLGLTELFVEKFLARYSSQAGCQVPEEILGSGAISPQCWRLYHTFPLQFHFHTDHPPKYATTWISYKSSPPALNSIFSRSNLLTEFPLHVTLEPTSRLTEKSRQRPSRRLRVRVRLATRCNAVSTELRTLRTEDESFQLV